jgi:peptide deformylase
MFEVINEQQTPELPPMKDQVQFLKDKKKFLNEFLAYAQSTKNAVGLASNQVAFNGERITDRFIAVCTTAGWEIAINPEVVEKHGDPITLTEGCLTWPDNMIVADRYPRVVVKYLNMKNEMHTRNADTQFESQVWQHEINHINGVEEKIVNLDHDTVRRDKPKVGRNDKCPCGSGRKYKKCCL